MGMNNRLLRPRQSGFNPRSISGLALWLDAADSQTLYTTDAGPVTAVSSPLDIAGCALWLDGSHAPSITQSGGVVSQWSDRSGNARHFTASGSAQPSYSATLNGLPVLTFNGSTNTLAGNAAAKDTIRNRAGYTFFAVSRVSSVAAGERLICGFGATVIFRAGQTASSPYAGGRRVAGDSLENITGTAGTLVSGSSYVTSVSVSHTSQAISGLLNGSVFATDTTYMGAGSSETIALDAFIGSQSAAYGLYSGDIAEVIVFDTALSATDRARVEAYLAAKWGISGVHTQATATNAPVGAWLNKASVGGAFTQSASTMRPALTAGYQNGKPAIVSDGVDDWLSASSASIGVASAAAATGVFVTKRTAAGSTAGWDFGTSASGQQSAGSGLVYDDFFRNVRTPGTFSGQSVSVTSITSPGSGGRGWRINGAQMSFVDSGAFAAPATAYVLGGPTFPSGFTSFGGGMCEALIYTRVLSEAEVAALERYLASKWGITLAPQVSNADAQDWVNRVYANGGTVSATTASAVNTFCNAIDAAGIRDRFYRLNLFCGASDANLNAVRTPLYRGPSLGGTQHGNTTDTNVNFVQGDYAETGAGAGLTGNGSTKFLRTGFSPFAAGLVETNAHQSAYLPSLGGSGGGYMAQGALQLPAEVTAWSLSPAYGGGNLFYRCGGTQNILTASYSAPKTGHVLAQRTGAASVAAYHRGVLMSGTINLAGDAAWTTTNSPGLTAIFARAEGGAFWYQGTLAGYSMGTSMTATQVAAYNDAMQAFQAALGRQA